MYTAQFPEALQLGRNHCNKLCESSLQLPQPHLDISRMSQSRGMQRTLTEGLFEKFGRPAVLANECHDQK